MKAKLAVLALTFGILSTFAAAQTQTPTGGGPDNGQPPPDPLHPWRLKASSPDNTINCPDWIQNPNGSWFAHTYARPFTVQNSSVLVVRGQFIFQNTMKVGSPPVDLWGLLNAKCGPINTTMVH